MEKNKKWNKETILALRERYKISQHVLANILGTRQQTISEWELGMYEPFNAYSKVLDLSEKALALMWAKSGQDQLKFECEIFNKYGGIKPGNNQNRLFKKAQKNEV